MNKLHALIVESDPDLAEILRIAIKEVGYTVNVTFDAGQGIESISPFALPYLVIIDIEHENPLAVKQLAAFLEETDHYLIYISPNPLASLQYSGKANHSMTLTKPVMFNQMRNLAAGLLLDMKNG